MNLQMIGVLTTGLGFLMGVTGALIMPMRRKMGHCFIIASVCLLGLGAIVAFVVTLFA